jgi:RNA polymerase sigma factor (sigma-70 family)
MDDASQSSESPRRTSPDPRISDVALVDRIIAGDSAALSELIRRHDRLVRYTVWRRSKDRCAQDESWLDSLASSVWMGFVESIRRSQGSPPQSIPAYLARIAVNQTISAVRSATRHPQPHDIDSADTAQDLAGESEDVAELLSRLEHLEALRSCIAELDTDDRTIAGQISAITERRWVQVAEALDMSESTLRSRWKRILGGLRTCMVRKTGSDFAPGGSVGDSLSGDRVSVSSRKTP